MNTRPAHDEMMTLPEAFVSQCHEYELTRQLPEVLATTAPTVALRVNRAKGARPLGQLQPVAWCETGYYLDKRCPFTFDAALHQGLYYVQDASSMAISSVIRRLSRDMVAPVYLDACAAPGGKTTAAIDALPPDAVVVANEYDSTRASALAQNLRRWGSGAVMVTRGDTARFAKCRQMFDIIAADVPCSGEGMMRKEARAVSQWSPSLVRTCAALQREIVANVWPALKPGGYLIYSTCTFNRVENEQNLRWIVDELGGEPVEVCLDEFEGVAPGIETELPCYRFIPGRVRGEGLFIGVIRKPGECSEARSGGKKYGKGRNTKADKRLPVEAEVCRRWLKGEYVFRLTHNGDLRAVPKAAAPVLDSIADSVGGVLAMGVRVGEKRGRDFVPTHDLACAADIDAQAFVTVEVTDREAVAYLRRETVVLPEDTPRGIVMLTYGGRPLGFMKNLGTRANTLMSTADRILSPMPDELPEPIIR